MRQTHVVWADRLLAELAIRHAAMTMDPVRFMNYLLGHRGHPKRGLT